MSVWNQGVHTYDQINIYQYNDMYHHSMKTMPGVSGMSFSPSALPAHSLKLKAQSIEWQSVPPSYKIMTLADVRLAMAILVVFSFSRRSVRDVSPLKQPFPRFCCFLPRGYPLRPQMP